MRTDFQHPDILIICGPTGAGKTAAAIEIAQRLPKALKAEIVGADSMQVYRQMDIGTAKPTLAEQALVRHHMVDILDPDEAFDAARYATMAREAIDGILARGVLPIVAGGTGLYIKALVYGLFPTHPSDPNIRERLKKERLRLGAEALHERLRACDPQTAQRVHPHDAYRIIRALEVWEITGKPLSRHHQAHQFSLKAFNTLSIGLDIERRCLYKRLDQRVDAMIDMGFLQEVKGLLKMGYTPDHKSMQSLGYRHMTAYLRGELDWPEAVRTMKRDIRRYAKRQMTWFRADNSIVWIDAGDRQEMIRAAGDFLAP